MSKKRKAAKEKPPADKAANRTEKSRWTPAAGLTRRGFMHGVGAASGAAIVAKDVHAAGAKPAVLRAERKTPITLKVNGKNHRLRVEPRQTLLRALRNDLDLTGTKEICDRGACGGCSVLLDGVLVNSCMTLAVDAAGKEISTIEGLASGDKLHPIQEEFVKCDALQCGFCTPGMVMACKALLDKEPKPNLTQIKRGLSGNICRCGTYNRIFAAVDAVTKRA